MTAESDPRPNPSPATDAAAALLGRLVEQGVEHIVLSPGSRSQALALVAASLEDRGEVMLHVRTDERVAGFLALGLGRETRMPAAVICTSGTAAANLLPAALEAHHAGVPLILLTADRPLEVRGVGANQTTRQPGMFSAATRFEADLPTPDRTDVDGGSDQTAVLRQIADAAVAEALGSGTRQAGPVHLNLPYREPLAGDLPDWLTTPFAAPDGRPDGHAVDQNAAPDVDPDSDPGPSGALYQGGGGIGESDVPAEPDDDPVMLEPGPRTIVVAGADAGPDAEELAHAGGWPLVAEVVSGARFGRELVHGYRRLLADPDLGGRVERVVVLGRPTLSREVTALLSRPDVEVLAVRGPGEPLNLNGATTAVDLIGITLGVPDRGWLGEWVQASRASLLDLEPAAPDADGLASSDPRERSRAVGDELAAIRAPLDRATLVSAVWRATWPHDRLVFGSSRLVRVADEVLGGKRVPVHSNRGLAGIDGTLATATGIALASQAQGAPGVTRVVLGDLAFLHDVGALLTAPGESEPRLQIVVGNDGGGTIFDGLEVASAASPAALRRVMYTPQEVVIGDLARAYGWAHVVATTRGELDQALTSPGGRVIIEVPLDR